MLRRPFKAVTKVYSPAYADSEAQTRSVQEGDRVLLSSTVLDAINSELKGDTMPYPIIFKVTNEAVKGVDLSTHVGVLEFSTQRGMAVFPPQIMKTLSLDDASPVSLRLVSLPTAGKAIFKPLTPEFADLEDPQAALQNAFRIYTTLTQGTIISLPVDGIRYDLFVQELYAAGKRDPVPAVCLIDSELIVDFVGMQERKDTSVTDLTMGSFTTDTLGVNERRHYRVKLEHPDLGIEIDCVPQRISSNCTSKDNTLPSPVNATGLRSPLASMEMGDPDLFISTQTLKPDELKCEWSDQELGRSHITIFPNDPKFSKTWYYITVSAYKKPCTYSLFVGAPRITEDEYKEAKAASKRTTGQLLRQTTLEGRELAADPNMELCPNCREYIRKGMEMRLHTARCQKQMWRCPVAECGQLIGVQDKDRHVHCDQCLRILASQEELAKHIDIVHVLRPCAACGMKLQMSQMNDHLTTECVKRLVQCKYCDLRKPALAIEEHVTMCGSRTVNCKICNKLVVLRKMDVHLAAEHGINPSLVDTSAYADEFKSNRTSVAPTLRPSTSLSEDEELARALAASLAGLPSGGNAAKSSSVANTGTHTFDASNEDAILASVIEASLREQNQSAGVNDEWLDIPDDDADRVSVGSWGD